MSFGRRLALFFVLIALVPTLALVGMFAIVSQDSREGKADARLAAGIETALMLYDDARSEARAAGVALARDPELAAALSRPDDPAALRAFARRALAGDVVAVAISAGTGGEAVSAGASDAIAFADTTLTRGGEDRGSLRVSTTTPRAYADEVGRLTEDEAVVVVGGEPVEATVSPPGDLPESEETEDLDIGGEQRRARRLALDPDGGEELLLIGPAKEEIALGGPSAAFLIACLLVGMAFAYTLARTLSRLHGQVAEQAITDPLTGLWNRRRMMQLLEREVARAQRFGGEISMVILDIDDFKQINDRRGHLHGDAVLQSIADTVRETTRSIDVGARYGGDELALVLIQTDAEGALILADRLRERVKRKEVPLRDGTAMDVTISVGVATLPDSAEGAEELIEAADQALLRAKRAGKDQTHVAPTRGRPKPRARPKRAGAKPRGRTAAAGKARAAAKRPAAGAKRPATGPKKPATGAKKPAAGAKKPATGPRKPATGPKRPAAGAKKPAAGARKAKPRAKKPAGGAKPRSSRSRKPKGGR